jgi:hypothetical protein
MALNRQRNIRYSNTIELEKIDIQGIQCFDTADQTTSNDLNSFKSFDLQVILLSLLNKANHCRSQKRSKSVVEELHEWSSPNDQAEKKRNYSKNQNDKNQIRISGFLSLNETYHYYCQ